MPKLPALFVTHGGGPLPVLGDPTHRTLTAWLKKAAAQITPLGKPKAIVSVTAHWETSLPTVSTCTQPPMLYDYGGFPPAAYTLQYPAPGSPDVAARIKELLGAAGIPCKEDARRGYDHGTFIPLMLMFPDADVPVVQMSIMESMNPEAHIKVGQALEPLRSEGVLIVASGSSYHNLRGMFAILAGERAAADDAKPAMDWDNWLLETCAAPPAERSARLEAWEMAPGARAAHPREEHLMPLLVASGAAGSDTGTPVFRDVVTASGNPPRKGEAGVPLSSVAFGLGSP